MPQRTARAPTIHRMPTSPTPTDLSAILLERRRRLDAALASLDASMDDAVGVIDAIVSTVHRGGTVVTCGNGGSAAEALHLAEELIGRYRGNRPAIRSTCLCADPTAITCIANDYGFEQVFARQAEAVLGPEDALVVFSTSGNSPNLLKALEVASRCGATRVGFLGGDGGAARPHCDAAIVVDGEDSAAIQEVHQLVMHACCEPFEID